MFVTVLLQSYHQGRFAFTQLAEMKGLIFPEKEPSIREEFVKVQGVRTSVLKLGQLRPAEPNGPPRVLMLLVPGNPGVPYFYEDFMQELHNHCDSQVPVWALGQAGHLHPPGEVLTLTDVVSTSERDYGLEAQVSHKLAFIRNHVPEDVSIILIGHSIGCYMILNILDNLPPKKVIRCFMLFPTIEKMAQSPNGRILTPVFRYFRWLVVFLTFFLNILPGFVQTKILRWHYRKVDYPECTQRALLETVTPWTVNFATYLAKIEMNKVTALQTDLVRRHLDKLSLYYGTVDGWTPVSYYHDFVAQFPEADARLCELKLKHAFILKKSEGRVMAKIIWEWAQSHHRLVPSTTKKDGGRWVFD